MNDWKKIEAPMFVISLYSEEREASVTILSTGQVNLFIAVTDDPHEMNTGNTFVGTLAQIKEEFGIPPRILYEEHQTVLRRKYGTLIDTRYQQPRMHPSAQGAELGADYHNKIMEQMQGRRQRLSAQELINDGHIIPGPYHENVNWELNISLPEHNGDINEHGKDLSKFLSGQSMPSWVKWVCIDGFGSMYWFENKPIAVAQGWIRDHGKGEIGPRCDIDGHNFRQLIWKL